MRFHWFKMALLLGSGLLCTSAFALSNTDYLKIRQASTLAPLDSATSLSAQLPKIAGQVLEIQGTVSGMMAGEKCSTLMLSVGADLVMVSFTQSDPDLTVDSNLRVLAQAPAQGAILRGIGATPVNASAHIETIKALSSSSIEQNFSAVYPANPVAYAQVPALTPQPKDTTSSYMPSASLANQPEVVQVYANHIQQLNGNLDSNTAKTIAYHLLAKSAAYGVDPRLMFALVTQESRFNAHAVSRCGAKGLGQLMPGTAAALGVQHPFDIAENLDGSVRYLADQLQRFGHISLALAAYNAGPNRVENCGCQIPQISETQNYVSVIWRNYATLAGFNPDSDGP